MKKIIKILTIPLLIAEFLVFSMLPAFAAEINSNPANVGDTVTYELRVNPCPNPIQALDVVLYYDSSSLEYVPYSLELPNISGFMTNTNLDGEIRFNAMDFVGFSFDEDKILSTVQFTVKDASSQNISLYYEIKTFIDSTTTDLRDTYLYDVTSVNGGVARISSDSESSDTSASTVSEKDSDLPSESNADNGDESDTEGEQTGDSDSDIDSAADTDTENDTDTTSDTDTNTETDTDTASDSDSEIIDRFDEFLTEINTDTASETESFVSSQPVNVNNRNNTKLYVTVAAVAVVVILIIGVIFTIIAKRSNDGSHFS